MRFECFLFLLILALAICRVEYCEKSVFYLHDESKNTPGENRCTNSCDCDGERTCSSVRWCQGTSREKSENYYYNEKLTNSECDPNSPIADFYCTKTRLCSSEGKCID